MKFFGYENHQPSKEAIDTEIEINLALHGIHGVAQLLGVFNDTEQGLCTLLTFLFHLIHLSLSLVSSIYRQKRFHDPSYAYPVLVMEPILGDSLLYRMIMQRDLSEQYLVPLFRNFIQIIDSFHKRNLIHRDLKLDNIMLVSAEADSEVKLVDFGMMVHLPEEVDEMAVSRHKRRTVYIDKYLTGTPGYYAPESISRHEYSFQSDVWQCGVILYTILVGHLPFGSDNPKHITTAKLEYLSDLQSDTLSISPMAIDLIRRMLTPDPDDRITIQEVLAHSWLNLPASTLAFGANYQKKIKNLACYETLKKAFHENNVEKESKSIRDGMNNVSFRVESIESQLMELKKKVIKNLFHVPILKDQPPQSGGESPTPPLPQQELNNSESEIFGPIHSFDDADLQAISLPRPPPDSSNTAESALDCPNNVTTILYQLENASIDYETFSRLATESNLDVLSIPELFSLFDIDHNGSIDLREFLLTILTLRNPTNTTSPTQSSQLALPDEFRSAKLYFDLFDLDGSGYLSRNEFLWMLSCLFHDGGLEFTTEGMNRRLGERRLSSSSNPTSNKSIEELFQALDLNQDNQIDYEEFQRFYQLMIVLAQNSPDASSQSPVPDMLGITKQLPSHPKYNYLKGAISMSSYTFSSTGSSQLYSTTGHHMGEESQSSNSIERDDLVIQEEEGRRKALVQCLVQ